MWVRAADHVKEFPEDADGTTHLQVARPEKLAVEVGFLCIDKMTTNLLSKIDCNIFTCGQASGSMAHKMSVGGGGEVPIFCHLGKSSKNFMSGVNSSYG